MRIRCSRQLPAIFIFLLFAGTAALAQEHVEPVGDPASADQVDVDAMDGHEFAEEDPSLIRRREESFLGWMIRCMGPIGLLIPVAGLFSFVLTLVVVMRCHGPFAFAALAFLVPIPFWLGLFGTLQGLIMSLQFIATSSVAPKPSEVSDGIDTALFNPMLGLVMMTPSYAAATLGSIIRSLAAPTVQA